MEIRIGVPGDRQALATTLAEAFDDDPVWTWLLPESQRHERLVRIFGALLRFALPRGHVYTTADRRAVAMWSPPGEWRLPLPALVKAAPDMVRAAGPHLPRLLGRLGAIEKLHGRQGPNHWYLEFIGTATGSRGAGAGSALMGQALQRFDAAGIATYLESSNPRNLGFYRRHGFAVTGEHTFSAGPPQWTLWRDAR
ncbi:ribosomal protein S18 acetylase RimI-like enzyme [Allocatelliglobosispora scoriae]|uniref:Ribosomal protein S18 acetylase RimI-like enzyme n=1 Tax=Allocatelliglobosispora scoriae TaxID=643052 RepID=A0A841BZF3_9ACTN|nr:GNAT family N-acetyltransferase [Allocatelliglobosispora scoriae]MBB5874537.1 ribosomal protein S18 acetylase RimI-like enzyme [Allocatelliglobosispora scoriae]